MKAVPYRGPKLVGPRVVLERGTAAYPRTLLDARNPPERLYVVGDPSALREGLAVVGARKATPYGLGCARRFAGQAAQRGIVIVSGGARGCDAEAHRAALAHGAPTVAFLGGGCDELYPPEHVGLFQDIVDAGGAVASEHDWAFPPLPHTFRARNRLIAGLARATLIVEAGLPSGTFSTADEALAAGRDVLAVPGSVTSESSHGANRLILQGATPVIDDESFQDALHALFGCLRQEAVRVEEVRLPHDAAVSPLIHAVQAEPLHSEDVRDLCARLPEVESYAHALEILAEAELDGLVARLPDGRWGPGSIMQ